MAKMATNDPSYLKPCQKIRSLQMIVRNELRNPYRRLPVIAAAKKKLNTKPEGPGKSGNIGLGSMGVRKSRSMLPASTKPKNEETS